MERPRPAYWKHIETAWHTIEIHDGPDVFLASFAAVPQPAADLVAAHWLVSEVRNGAFPQFFFNSTGVLAPEAVRALQRIGLGHAAEVVAAAMTYFDEPYPRDLLVRRAMIGWVWEGELTETEQNDLDIMLDLSGQFLDALGSELQLFQAAADAYADVSFEAGRSVAEPGEE